MRFLLKNIQKMLQRLQALCTSGFTAKYQAVVSFIRQIAFLWKLIPQKRSPPLASHRALRGVLAVLLIINKTAKIVLSEF
jgi:hypothetical protein